MSNELQKQSIVELYEQRPWAIKLAIQYFLDDDTVPDFITKDFGISSLSVLKELFDWDTKYVLCSEHYVMCQSIEIRTALSSREEAEEYLNGEKLIYASSSDWNDYDPDFENDFEIESSKIVTEVVNVRLKSQSPSKDAVALT